MTKEFANIVIWCIPILIYLWIGGMWVAMVDDKKRRTKEKKKMNWLSALGTTLLCVIVGVAGYGGGAWYASNILLDSVVSDVQEITSTADEVLSEVKSFTSKKSIDRKIDKIRTSVENSVENDLNVISKDIDEANKRISELTEEIKSSIVEIKHMLLDVEGNVKNYAKDSVIKSEVEIQKELGVMYDKVDSLYKQLEEVSNTLDTIKESKVGKKIFK
jgi:DNA anti-recombination protein RmuC